MKDRRLYECVQCGKFVPIRSKNLCQFCRYKQKGNQAKNYTIKQQTSKNKLKKDEKRAILEPFFRFHTQNIAKNGLKCDNCGVKLSSGIMNVAHILPKRNFGGNPEVMGELENCIYLCSSFDGIDCHNRFDRIQGSSQVYLMPCWEKVVEKYLTFREKAVKYSKYKQVLEDYIDEKGL